MRLGESKTDGQPIVELKGVCKSFDGNVVLDGIDLALQEGQTTVILGESGAGKSVILKHIVRLLRPDRGQVCFRGRRIDDLSERELAQFRPEFGFLFQLGALFDSMTVRDNIAFPIQEHRRIRQSEVDQIVHRKLAMVGLEGVEHKWPAELSGGQKKRVALARAIALDPNLILYDEPTTGLDPPRSDVINELIIKLKRELGVTSVVVTHDMASAMKVADRMLMLSKGRFIFDGTSETITQTTDSRVRHFVEGRADDDDLRSLKATGER